EERRGDLDSALRLLHRAAVLDPRHARTALELGELYFRMERLDEAREWLQRAASLDTTMVESHVVLAAVHEASGDDDAAAFANARADHMRTRVARTEAHLTLERRVPGRARGDAANDVHASTAVRAVPLAHLNMGL